MILRPPLLSDQYLDSIEARARRDPLAHPGEIVQLVAEVRRLRSELAAESAENAEMRLALSDRALESDIASAAVRQATEPLLALLRRLEWSGKDDIPAFGPTPGSDPICPICAGYPVLGHTPDCALAQALSDRALESDIASAAVRQATEPLLRLLAKVQPRLIELANYREVREGGAWGQDFLEVIAQVRSALSSSG